MAPAVVRIVSRCPTRSELVRRLFHFFSEATLVWNTRAMEDSVSPLFTRYTIFDCAADPAGAGFGTVVLAITASALRVSTSGAGLSVRAASKSVGARGTI